MVMMMGGMLLMVRLLRGDEEMVIGRRSGRMMGGMVAMVMMLMVGEEFGHCVRAVTMSGRTDS